MSNSTIKHNDHKVSAERRKALEARTEQYISTLQAQNQPLLTRDERNILFNKRLALYKSMAAPLGVDIDKFVSGFKDISAEKQKKISAARHTRNIKLRDHSLATHIPRKPVPFPRTFLLQRVTPVIIPLNQDPPDNMTFREDTLGQHFVGGFEVTDWNGELHASFGMLVDFTLPAADLPEPVLGGYISTPTLFINGQIQVFGPGGDPFQGRGVASGDLIVSQRVFQDPFGSSGPVDTQIGFGSSNVPSVHFDLEDADVGTFVNMPGSVEMPTVQIPSFLPELDINVTLDVHIQCYLKSQAASLDAAIQMLVPEWALVRAT